MKNLIKIALTIVMFAALIAACKHDPIQPKKDPNQLPTATPCDADTVYFHNDILPILISNCAMAGCHNEQSAADGVILSNYNSVINTADVRAGRPDDSDLYERITDSDPNKRMPPPPNSVLLPEQISLIHKWILQGAKNNRCEESASECDTMAMTYSANIAPILNTNCIGCHNQNLAYVNIQLHNYAEVVNAVQSNRMMGAIKHSSGFSPMPQGGAKLSDCNILKIEAWINQGMTN